jgi:hypothetical protein
LTLPNKPRGYRSSAPIPSQPNNNGGGNSRNVVSENPSQPDSNDFPAPHGTLEDYDDNDSESFFSELDSEDSNTEIDTAVEESSSLTEDQRRLLSIVNNYQDPYLDLVDLRKRVGFWKRFWKRSSWNGFSNSDIGIINSLIILPNMDFKLKDLILDPKLMHPRDRDDLVNTIINGEGYLDLRNFGIVLGYPASLVSLDKGVAIIWNKRLWKFGIITVLNLASAVLLYKYGLVDVNKLKQKIQSLRKKGLSVEIEPNHVKNERKRQLRSRFRDLFMILGIGLVEDGGGLSGMWILWSVMLHKYEDFEDYQKTISSRPTTARSRQKSRK